MSLPLSVAVSSIPVASFRSGDAPQSRISGRFLSDYLPRKSRLSFVTASVSVAVHGSSFTCVLDFVVDPSSEACDVVLGIDWSSECDRAGMSHLKVLVKDSLGNSDYSPLPLPERCAFPPAPHVASSTSDDLSMRRECDDDVEMPTYVHNDTSMPFDDNHNTMSLDDKHVSVSNKPHVMIENVINDIASNNNKSYVSSSSSYVQPLENVECRTGASFLEEFLLCNRTSGITASPFTTNLQTLQDSVRFHGIIVNGLSLDEYKSILLRHIFSGDCVNGPNTNDRTACRHFANSFSSAQDMTHRAYDIMSSAAAAQRSTDELLLLFRMLGLQTAFRPSHLRRQVMSELKKLSLSAASSISAGQEFHRFEKHDRASLLAIASSHRIHVERFTSTNEQLRTAIMAHFAEGRCCHVITHSISELREGQACKETVHSFLEEDRTELAGSFETIRDQFMLRWLSEQCKSLTLAPLRRLLAILQIDFDPEDDLRKLRSNMKKFITNLRNKINSPKYRDEDIERQLSQLRTEWPVPIPDSLKDKLVRLFREQTSSALLAPMTCASCAERCLASECTKVRANGIDLSMLERPDSRILAGSENMAVDPTWLDCDTTAPVFPKPITINPNVLVDPDGVSVNEDGEFMLSLCKTCRSSIQSHKVPPLALANHMVLGKIPDELKDLTVVEEAMIAKCRAKCWVIQLKEENSDLLVPNSQRGVKGHIIIYPQQPSAIATILPPALEEVSTPICVIFVGSSPPTKEWLQKKAKPLVVRREKVRRALMWLKEHNTHYKNIVVNESLLNSMPDEFALPVHVEHILPNDERDALTARYDSTVPTDIQSSQDNSDLNSRVHSDRPNSNAIPFQNVVITDVDSSAPPNELRAAAVRHIKRKGGAYVAIPHDPTPVNEFFNPELFPMIYPTLFPYGIGGFENFRRSTKVSMKRHVKHLFNLSDRRFQEHYSFLFTVFNILQRREILLHSSLKVKRQNFHSFASSFASVSAEAVHKVTERVSRGDWVTENSNEERQVLKLMKEVNIVTSHVPGSSASRVAMRNEIRALMMEKGLPSFYITINPADVYNPLVKFLAGSDIDIDNLASDDVPNYWEQSVLVAKNPAVAAQFFDTYMRAFISTLLGYDPKQRNLDGGVLGVVKAYYGCVEAQGRGTLHCHMLIWIEGGLDPNEIKERVMRTDSESQEFARRLLGFLDDTISNNIPDDPDSELQVPSTAHHPCSVRGLSLDDVRCMDAEALKIARHKDMHHLVKQCQVHSHSATCYKYWKGPPEPKDCRFDLDESNVCPESHFDPVTGELTLRCLDGMVNNFNATILEAMRCNMDIKVIGSGPSAKAILYYITDYISKTQLKAHVAFAALELAVNKLEGPSGEDDDLIIRAKKLLQKCGYAMISHQELSAQQVCSYLMDYGDHYTSHEFKNLYWTAFEKFINDENPSPECYNNTALTTEEIGAPDTGFEDADVPDSYQTVHGESDEELVSEGSEESQYNLENPEEEVTVGVKANGELIAHTSQVLDYQLRSESLEELCLWDVTAQVEKVRRTKDRKSDDTEDALEEHEILEEIEPDHEHGDRLQPSELLSSTSRLRPRFEFSYNHPEEITHVQRIRSPTKRFVPVPIGPSIPRRDREAVRERYCRLMLILFKPWRHAHDLRTGSENWSTAFEIFMQTCPPEKAKVMDNMQILHECKDSRDDHFVNRRSRNRNRANQLPGGQTTSRVTEDDFGAGDESEKQILDHLVSMQSARSDAVTRAQSDVLTCLHYANLAGLFDSERRNQEKFTDYSKYEEVFEQKPHLEELWKKTYEDRRQEWKRKARSHPAANPSADQTSHVQVSSICDGTEFRQIINDSPSQQATINQNIQATNADRDVDIEKIVQEYTLNREQARAFRIVASHSLEDKPKPLRMYLGGPGGTGKSRVINALKAFFDRRNQARRFRLSSYTGVAAKNISGMTLHAALLLNQRTSKGTSGKTRRDLIAMWEGVDYLFIDEVSMIGCRLLLKVSQALNDAKQNQSPFGGINVVFAGDFAQLAPVGDPRLFSHINTHEVKTSRGQQAVFGKLLWLSIKTVVTLTEVMRQSGEENMQFVRLLGRLRDGQCTDADYDLLNTRQLKNLNTNKEKNGWQDTPLIVSGNEVKDALNVRATLDFATRTNQEVHWYYSSDVHGGNIVSDPALREHLQKMHSGKTNQRLGKIPLVIGMPVMICQNFDIEGGIVNGCVGILEKVRYRTDSEGRRHAISCEVKAPTSTAAALPNLPHQHVVALEDTVEMRFVHPHSNKTCTIKRTQVPITPAFAMTAHKAQGQSMDRVIVDPESSQCTESPYVMFSRATSLNGLAILRPFDKRKIQGRLSEDRRREAKRLEYLRLHTVLKHGDEEESTAAQQVLSRSRYRDRINMDDDEGIETPTVDSVRRLQNLQHSNYQLTSAPLPSTVLPRGSAGEPMDLDQEVTTGPPSETVLGHNNVYAPLFESRPDPAVMSSKKRRREAESFESRKRRA